MTPAQIRALYERAFSASDAEVLNLIRDYDSLRAQVASPGPVDALRRHALRDLLAAAYVLGATDAADVAARLAADRSPVLPEGL